MCITLDISYAKTYGGRRWISCTEICLEICVWVCIVYYYHEATARLPPGLWVCSGCHTLSISDIYPTFLLFS